VTARFRAARPQDRELTAGIVACRDECAQRQHEDRYGAR